MLPHIEMGREGGECIKALPPFFFFFFIQIGFTLSLITNHLYSGHNSCIGIGSGHADKPTLYVVYMMHRHWWT